MESNDQRPAVSRHDPLIAALFLALVLLVFGGALANGFAVDDSRIVLRNPVVRTLDPTEHLLNPFWSRWEVAHEYYRPLVTWTLAVDRLVYGTSPWGYHLTNLAIHGLTAFLLFVLLRRVGGSLVAAVGAVGFAVHPVQTEAVVWVVGRTDLLAGMFTLLAGCLYLRLPDRPGRPDVARISMFTFALGAALLSKEAAVTFPALAVALDLARQRALARGWAAALRQALARLMRLGPVYAGVIAGYLALRFGVTGQLVGGAAADDLLWRNSLVAASLGERLLTIVGIAARYVRLVVWPRTLTIDYQYDVIPLVRSVFSVSFLLPLFCVLACVAVVTWLATRRPAALFGGLYFGGAYLLVSHLLFVGPMIMAERMLYLPMVGVAAVFASAVSFAASWAGSRRTVAGAALALIVLAPLAWRSRVRTEDWKNDFTLFTAAVRAEPRSALAWNNLGYQQLLDDRPQAALDSFERSTAIYSGYERARRNRVTAMRELGRLEDAELELRRMVGEFPHSGAVGMQLVEVLGSRAERLERVGEPQAALELRREAVEIARREASRAAVEASEGIVATFLMHAARNLQSLSRFEEARAAYDEAVSSVERELTRDEAVPEAIHGVRALVLAEAASFYRGVGRPAEAASRYAAAAESAERTGEPGLAAQMLLESARSLAAVGRTDEARDALAAAESIEGASARLIQAVREEQAGLLGAAGEIDRALELAERERSDGRSPSGVLTAAAEGALENDRAAVALPIYDRLLGEGPVEPRVRHGRARALIALGRLDEAERQFDELLSGEVGDRLEAVLWADRAEIAQRRNDRPEAIRRLDRALAANPEYVIARLRRALMLEQIGRLDAAETDLLHIVESGVTLATEAEAWQRLASIARARGDRSAAEERKRRCLALRPDCD